jgi:hypothetical protein
MKKYLAHVTLAAWMAFLALAVWSLLPTIPVHAQTAPISLSFAVGTSSSVCPAVITSPTPVTNYCLLSNGTAFVSISGAAYVAWPPVTAAGVTSITVCGAGQTSGSTCSTAQTGPVTLSIPKSATSSAPAVTLQ